MSITIRSGDLHLQVKSEGTQTGRVVMFGNSLGTDMRVWDPVLPYLQDGCRVVRFDKRGHGLSDGPAAPYTMDDIVEDALAVIAHFGLADITFVGLSIGGLIAQGIAAKRPDLLRAIVLMDTAAKIGTTEMWEDRMASVEDLGLTGMSETILDRWFAPGFRNDEMQLAPWRNMLTRTPLHGYLGCCAAIAGADFSDTTQSIDVPVMAMAGEHDGSTPPDLVRQTAELCGGRFHLIKDAGHLPGVEHPKLVAGLINEFLKET